MFSINLSSFVFGRRTSTFAALVAGFGMDRRGALRIIEIGNGFAGRAKAGAAACGAGEGENHLRFPQNFEIALKDSLLSFDEFSLKGGGLL